MFAKLCQQEVIDMRLPVLMGPIRWHHTSNEFAKPAFTGLFRPQHLGRKADQGKTRRNNIVNRSKRHGGIS
jgi:hypothetical protein